MGASFSTSSKEPRASEGPRPPLRPRPSEGPRPSEAHVRAIIKKPMLYPGIYNIHVKRGESWDFGNQDGGKVWGRSHAPGPTKPT